MSTVFVQVGQAGNQLGSHLWTRAVHQAQQTQERIVRSLRPSELHDPTELPVLPASSCLHCATLFSSSSYAHALLVDTEPKVLRSVCSLSAGAILSPGAGSAGGHSLFHRDGVFVDQYGRGNNWSLGYSGRLIKQQQPGRPASAAYRPSVLSVPSSSLSSSEAMVSSIVERLRVEAECMDCFDSIFLIHSVGGGTGSGLGSLLLERLRDLYPAHSICSASILPFARGETPLQHYNTCLTLSHLQRFCDAVFLFQNDTALDVLSAMLQSRDWARTTAGKGAAGLPFSVLNSWIADCLCDVLLPMRPPADVSASASLHSLSSLPALLSTLCPVPRLKLLDTWTSSGLLQPTEHEPLSWTAITDTLDHCTQLVVRAADANSGPQPMLDFAVIARGAAGLPMEPWDRTRIDERIGRHLSLSSCARRAPVVPSSSQHPRLGAERYAGRVGERLLVDGLNASLSFQSASLAVCANHSRHVGYLRTALATARAMHSSKAYLHWYERQNCSDADFRAAFDTVQEVIEDYTAWTID